MLQAFRVSFRDSKGRNIEIRLTPSLDKMCVVNEWRSNNRVKKSLFVAECLNASSQPNLLRYVALSTDDELEQQAKARYSVRNVLQF